MAEVQVVRAVGPDEAAGLGERQPQLPEQYLVPVRGQDAGGRGGFVAAGHGTAYFFPKQ
jgi:hypothetical protein